MRIEKSVCADSLTSYCVGGDIDFLITVDDSSALPHVLREIKDKGMNFLILGAGTNMLVADNGFRGLFIKLGENFRTVSKISEMSIYAGGALLLADLVAFIRANKLGGLAFLAGIPGTLGGAIAMNAGAFGCNIADSVLWVDAVDSKGEILRLEPGDCDFGYRSSRIRNEKLVVLGAGINVVQSTAICEEVDCNLQYRGKKHISGAHYAGSVFKNPTGDYAGKLIDESGLKGLRVGSACISGKHANFIIADTEGYALDVFEIMQIAAKRVYRFTGIKLQPEIELIGFDIEWDDIFKE